MDRNEVKGELLEIMKPYLPDTLDHATVEEKSDLINDLQINSAHIVDIVLDIEDKFDIMIEDDVIGNMNTVEDAINVILEKAPAA